VPGGGARYPRARRSGLRRRTHRGILSLIEMPMAGGAGHRKRDTNQITTQTVDMRNSLRSCRRRGCASPGGCCP
jgi:hypothetical protein